MNVLDRRQTLKDSEKAWVGKGSERTRQRRANQRRRRNRCVGDTHKTKQILMDFNKLPGAHVRGAAFSAGGFIRTLRVMARLFLAPGQQRRPYRHPRPLRCPLSYRSQPWLGVSSVLVRLAAQTCGTCFTQVHGYCLDVFEESVFLEVLMNVVRRKSTPDLAHTLNVDMTSNTKRN